MTETFVSTDILSTFVNLLEDADHGIGTFDGRAVTIHGFRELKPIALPAVSLFWVSFNFEGEIVTGVVVLSCVVSHTDVSIGQYNALRLAETARQKVLSLSDRFEDSGVYNIQPFSIENKESALFDVQELSGSRMAKNPLLHYAELFCEVRAIQHLV